MNSLRDFLKQFLVYWKHYQSGKPIKKYDVEEQEEREDKNLWEYLDSISGATNGK